VRRNSERGGELRRANLLRPSSKINIGNPARHKPGRVGKKKMRSLGSVQLPTEAFMAVLKLDSED